MRVLAGTLAILLLGDQLLFLFARETLEQFAGRLLPTWLHLKVFGPFLAYEIVALVVLRYRRARGKSMPPAARFANAVIETSLPTVILWWMNLSCSVTANYSTRSTTSWMPFVPTRHHATGSRLPQNDSSPTLRATRQIALRSRPGSRNSRKLFPRCAG